MQNNNKTGPGSAGPAHHPQREEWMGFVYGEVSRQEKSVLTAHLNECSLCRAEVELWQNAMHALDEGKTATFYPRVLTHQLWLKWGIAAAVILFIGFGVGRFASAAADRKLRASLKSELREELLTELKQEQGAQLTNLAVETENRAAENKAIFTMLGKMQAAHDADLVWLREHLETVALNTQNSLQYEQQQIVSLANNNSPSDTSH